MIELTLLVLVLLVAIAMSFVMNDAFRRLYLEDGWRTYGYVAVTAGCTLVVLWYTLWFAPRKLAEKYAVGRPQVFRSCRLPYIAYTPYSVILLVGLALPVFAALSVSLYNDVSGMIDARHDLSRNGDRVATVSTRSRHRPRTASQSTASSTARPSTSCGALYGVTCGSSASSSSS